MAEGDEFMSELLEIQKAADVQQRVLREALPTMPDAEARVQLAAAAAREAFGMISRLTDILRRHLDPGAPG